MASEGGAGPDPSLVRRVEKIVSCERTGLVCIARDHGPPDNAEDIVQDALANVLSGEVEPKGTLDTDEELLGWLRRVVRNVARNRRREEGVRTHESLDVVENHPLRVDHGPARAWRLYRDLRFRRALARALRELTDSEWEVMEPWLLDGYLPREIADARGSSVSTVKTLLRRGMAKLRASLEEWSGP